MRILLGVDFPCSTAWPTKPSTWWSPQWGLKTVPLTTVACGPTVMQVSRKSAHKPLGTAWQSCLSGQLTSLDIASFFPVILWSSLAFRGALTCLPNKKRPGHTQGSTLASDGADISPLLTQRALAARVPVVGKGDCTSERLWCPGRAWYRAGLDKDVLHALGAYQDGAGEGPTSGEPFGSVFILVSIIHPLLWISLFPFKTQIGHRVTYFKEFPWFTFHLHPLVQPPYFSWILFGTSILLTVFGEHFSFTEEHWDIPRKLSVKTRIPASQALSLELSGIPRGENYLQGKPTMWCQK